MIPTHALKLKHIRCKVESLKPQSSDIAHLWKRIYIPKKAEVRMVNLFSKESQQIYEQSLLDIIRKFYIQNLYLEYRAGTLHSK